MGKSAEKPLDKVPARRGPRARVRESEVVGRANNFRFSLNQVWERLWPLLSAANDAEGVTKAFEEVASPYSRDYVPQLAPLILAVVKERRFPKRRNPQVNFLADSLAAVGDVTPRRSRDICAEYRAKEKRAKLAHRIQRYEFYVECTCGYRGPSRDFACPTCRAKIVFGFHPFTDADPFAGK